MKIESSLVVGGGTMAVEHHLPRLWEILKCRDITLFELQQARRDKLRSRFRFKRGVRVVDRLPDDDSYDLVVIATPPKFHFEYFEKLSGRSQSFLIEKPMTIDLEQAVRLESMAAALGKTVYVNMIRRSLQSYQVVKEIVRSGEFGALKAVNVAEGSVYQWEAVSSGSFSRELNGGGVLMDTGPHAVDLMFQVFEDLAFRGCVMDGKAPAIEANCQLSLTASGGVPVELLLSRNRYLSNKARFEFAEAVLEVGVLSETVQVKKASGRSYERLPHGVAEDVTWPDLVDKFYEMHLANSDNSGVGPAESRKVAEILDRSYAETTFVAGAF